LKTEHAHSLVGDSDSGHRPSQIKAAGIVIGKVETADRPSLAERTTPESIVICQRKARPQLGPGRLRKEQARQQ
jgi:hypothetical protein